MTVQRKIPKGRLITPDQTIEDDDLVEYLRKIREHAIHATHFTESWVSTIRHSAALSAAQGNDRVENHWEIKGSITQRSAALDAAIMVSDYFRSIRFHSHTTQRESNDAVLINITVSWAEHNPF